MPKKLYRSNDNGMLAGVLAGFSEYFKFDPTVVRLVFIALWIFTVAIPMTLFYFAAAIIIPKSDVYNR